VNQQILQMLRQFGRDGRSGIFTCESGEATRYLVLKDGLIVGARSNLVSERLGEFLVRQGVISKQHLRDGSLFARRGKRLGEVLASLDVIDEEEIAHYVSQQAMEIACTAVLQADSGADFEDRKDVVQVLPEPLTVFEVLMEVSRRATAVRKLVSGLQKEERSLEISEDAPTVMDRVRLRAYEAFVLQRIRKGESVASIFSGSPVSAEQTARAIVGYLSAGIVEFADAPGEAKAEVSDVATPVGDGG
jgi:hypothetical protein